MRRNFYKGVQRFLHFMNFMKMIDSDQRVRIRRLFKISQAMNDLPFLVKNEAWEFCVCSNIFSWIADVVYSMIRPEKGRLNEEKQCEINWCSEYWTSWKGLCNRSETILTTIHQLANDDHQSLCMDLEWLYFKIWWNRRQSGCRQWC